MEVLKKHTRVGLNKWEIIRMGWKKSQYFSNISFSKASLIQRLHSLFINQTFPHQHIMMNPEALLTIHDSWSTWAHLQEQPSTLSSVLLQSRAMYRRIHCARRLVSACGLTTLPHYLQIHCAVRLTERWIIYCPGQLLRQIENIVYLHFI